MFKEWGAFAPNALPDLRSYKYDAKGRITEEIISGKDLALNPDDKLRPKEKRVYTYRE